MLELPVPRRQHSLWLLRLLPWFVGPSAMFAFSGGAAAQSTPASSVAAPSSVASAAAAPSAPEAPPAAPSSAAPPAAPSSPLTQPSTAPGASAPPACAAKPAPVTPRCEPASSVSAAEPVRNPYDGWNFKPGHGARLLYLPRAGFNLSPASQGDDPALSSYGLSVQLELPRAGVLRGGFEFGSAWLNSVTVSSGPLRGAQLKGGIGEVVIVIIGPLIEAGHWSLDVLLSGGPLIGGGELTQGESQFPAVGYATEGILRMGVALGPTFWFGGSPEQRGDSGAGLPAVGLAGSLGVDARILRLEAFAAEESPISDHIVLVELTPQLGVVVAY